MNTMYNWIIPLCVCFSYNKGNMKYQSESADEYDSVEFIEEIIDYNE